MVAECMHPDVVTVAGPERGVGPPQGKKVAVEG
jgi:hypothetical protein